MESLHTGAPDPCTPPKHPLRGWFLSSTELSFRTQPELSQNSWLQLPALPPGGCVDVYLGVRVALMPPEAGSGRVPWCLSPCLCRSC